MRVSSLSSSSPPASRTTAGVTVAAAIVFVATTALILTIVVVIAGGFVIDVGPVHLSFRRWLRPAILSLVAWMVCAVVTSMRRQVSSALEALTLAIEQHARAIALVIAASAAACGIAYSTYAASGSDAAGYIAEAELLAVGDFTYDEPLARRVQWPDATATFAPLAFRPALAPGSLVPTPGRLAPTYPPGLPLAMIAARALAADAGPCLVAPFLGALAVFATFLLARHVHSNVAGIVAAALLGTSPIFLFEIVQPMSDVPATGLWTLALMFALIASDPLRARTAAIGVAALAGVIAGLAIMTRPNLVPLIVPLVIAVRLKADPTYKTGATGRQQAAPKSDGRKTAPTSDNAIAATSDTQSPVTTRQVRTLAVLGGLAPAALAIAWLQWKMYGSPLESGYGPGAFRDFFSLANIAPNVRDYASRVIVGELPALGLTCLATAAWMLKGRRRSRTSTPDLIAIPEADTVPRVRRARVILLAGFVTTVVLCYLPYGVFPDWWYLRFLLPALPMAFSLMAIAIARASAEMPVRARGLLLLTALTVACTFNVVTARHQQAFLLRASEARYQLAGRYLAAMAPSNAVIVTVQDSAAVHVYTHLPILRWDQLSIDLDAALAQLADLGRHPLLLVEEWERTQLRAKFPASAAARLDWAPLADFGDPVRIGLFDPMNRETATDRVH